MSSKKKTYNISIRLVRIYSLRLKPDEIAYACHAIDDYS